MWKHSYEYGKEARRCCKVVTSMLCIFNLLTTETFATSKQFRYTGYFICFLIALFLRNKFKDKKSE